MRNVYSLYDAAEICLRQGLDIKTVIVERLKGSNPNTFWDVISYEFMSGERRNVATYTPLCGLNTLTIQPGVDGKGRVYGLKIEEEKELEFLDYLKEKLEKEQKNLYTNRFLTVV